MSSHYTASLILARSRADGLGLVIKFYCLCDQKRNTEFHIRVSDLFVRCATRHLVQSGPNYVTPLYIFACNT